jgi:sugar (pentulose or hexulose) kinase
VDIGTTHIKAVLLAGDGSVVSMAKLATPVTSDGTGPCHDPEEIRAVAEQAMRQAQRSAPAAGPVTAVGVTSVGEEGVPLGPGGELLYPSIAWYERRPSAAAREWSARHPDEELFAVTGLHKDLGFTVFKWLWLKSARPDVWSRCRRWLGIADYVIWRWTGQQGMSVSHASRIGIFSLSEFRWQPGWAAEALARGADALPPLHDAGTPVGFLRPGAIPDLAVAAEVPVVVTGLDHTVGAHAAGVVAPGQILDSMGTAEALIEPVPASSLREADYSLAVDFSAGVASRSHIAIAGLASGAGVGGLLRQLGVTSPEQQQRLESEAARLPPGADGLVYIPPRMRSETGGALLGLKAAHAPAHIYRAVVEGWALAADDVLRALGTEASQRQVVCIGGGSSSPLWGRVKASIGGTGIRCLTTPEIVAIGAALLAGRAKDGPGTMTGWQPAASTVHPVPDWLPGYRSLREEFSRAAAMIHPGPGGHVYP